MKLSDTKTKELIHALAKGTKVGNIVAAEGLSPEFIEEFAHKNADEIAKRRLELRSKFKDYREDGRRYGIDVSSWQGVIEWNKVKLDKNGKFAILRAAYGEEIDSRFEDNYRDAVKAGVPVGAYLYTLATTEQEAIAEADRLITLIKGKKFDYPIALDIEEQAQAELGMERVSAIVEAFCHRIEQAKCYVCVYSYESFIAEYLSSEIKRKYDIWVADVGATPDMSYGMHQYSFSGSVDGIDGNVDLDLAVRDYPDIMRKNRLNGY